MNRSSWPAVTDHYGAQVLGDEACGGIGRIDPGVGVDKPEGEARAYRWVRENRWGGGGKVVRQLGQCAGWPCVDWEVLREVRWRGKLV